MTFLLQGQDGFVMELGNASDYWNIITAVEKVTKKGPLIDFINTGKTVDTYGVIQDIKKIMPLVDESVHDKLQELSNGLQKAGAYGVVTQ